MDIDAEFHVVTVVYKRPLPGLDFGLDESMHVVYMEPSALLGHLFCVNDQVLFVNGVLPRSPTEAMALMEKHEGEIVVSVLRSEHVEPIPKERSKTIANDGIANNILFPGDFILDVDGTRRHNMSASSLKKHITANLIANGECSMIVERAEKYDTRVITLNALKLKPMSKNMDPDMPIDASIIGSKQAEFHYRNNRQAHSGLKPCLKGAKPPEKERETKRVHKKLFKKKKFLRDTASTVVDSVTTDDETTCGKNDSKTTTLTDCATTIEPNTVTEATIKETEQLPSSNTAIISTPIKRKVNWSSHEPDIQFIAMNHEAGVPLQKVPERKRQNNLMSNSSISASPKSSPGKSAAMKTISTRQKKSTASVKPAISLPKRQKKTSDSRVGRINMIKKRCVTTQRRTPAASINQKPTGLKKN